MLPVGNLESKALGKVEIGLDSRETNIEALNRMLEVTREDLGRLACPIWGWSFRSWRLVPALASCKFQAFSDLMDLQRGLQGTISGYSFPKRSPG